MREHATDKLFEKVAARRAELEAELEKLAQYGKPVKKPDGAPVVKVKKAEEAKESVAQESVAKQSAVKEPVAKEPATKAA